MSDLKFGHFYFFGPPLTPASVEVKWKTSNHICSSVKYVSKAKYPRFLILSWEKEYLQTKRLLNATSHFLISHIVGHLFEFIKISLGPPILKIDDFT